MEDIGPSSPALVVGLSVMPVVGEVFRAFKNKEDAAAFIAALPKETAVSASRGLPKAEIEGRPVFNIILKGDVAGSVEALEESLKKLESGEVGINILRSGAGDIGETDIKLALATKLVTVVGFKVGVDSSARELAEKSNIHIFTGDVIYNLLEEVKRGIEDMLPPVVKRTDLGRAKILKIFKKDGSRQIVGGRVEEGVIKKGASIEVRRGQEILGQGNILQLQRNKQNVEEIGQGSEFGILTDCKAAIQENDWLDIFQDEVIKRKL